MPKLDSFFEKENKIEQIMTKKMHPQLISYKNLKIDFSASVFKRNKFFCHKIKVIS